LVHVPGRCPSCHQTEPPPAVRAPRLDAEHTAYISGGAGGAGQMTRRVWNCPLALWLAGYLTGRRLLTVRRWQRGARTRVLGMTRVKKGGRGWARRSRSGPRAEIERDAELQPAIVSPAEYSTCPPLFGCQGWFPIGSGRREGCVDVWCVNPGRPPVWVTWSRQRVAWM
jgi:hypothetical protein